MPENTRLLLAVDTSSQVVSAAVAAVRNDGADVLAARDVAAANRHGELLADLVQEVLKEAGVTPRAISAVTAGLGPGPFTGLRVGVVTASSLANALAVPAYGACSLDAVARAHAATGDFLVCTDARRKQVYWARYDAQGSRTEGPDIATPTDVAARFATEVGTVIGAGVGLYPDAFSVFGQRVETAVSATDLAHLVADKVRAGAPSDVMEPMYLRRPDAAPPGRPKSVLPA